MTGTVLVLNGPNLNMLGVRDPRTYGSQTLADVERRVRASAESVGLQAEFVQSNHEGVLIDTIHEWREQAAGVIINPGGYSHTSVALHDALELVEGPVIEVHLSNIHRREPFRHHSYVSSVATGVIAGLGAKGYELAVEALADMLQAGP